VDRNYKEPVERAVIEPDRVLSNELPRLADSSGALTFRFGVLTMTRRSTMTRKLRALAISNASFSKSRCRLSTRQPSSSQ